MRCEFCPHCQAAQAAISARPDEQLFWYDYRRGLQQVISAIERRWSIGKYEPRAHSGTRLTAAEEAKELGRG